MLKKLLHLQYFKREIIFSLDLLLSLVSTFVTCVIVLSLVRNADNQNIILKSLGISFIVSAVLIFAFSLHKSIIRYFSISDALKLIAFAVAKSILILIVERFIWSSIVLFYFAGMDMLLTAFLMISTRSVMVTTYHYIINYARNDINNSFIYSTRGTNPTIAMHINRDESSKYKIQGFLTTNKEKVGSRISDRCVFYVNQSEEHLIRLFAKKRVTSVIFTSNEAFKSEKDGLVAFCLRNHIIMYMIGQMEELDQTSQIKPRQIKPIQIEDLLERPEIQVDIDKISSDIANKVVMVTGAAGSIGSELARQIAIFKAKKLVLVDSAETPLHSLSIEFKESYPNLDVSYILGDVRSKQRMTSIIEKFKPSILFHAAAYKHVPAIEDNPCEGVLTNVWGSVNVAQLAIQYSVDKFVMVSTDKAVNPTNVMGATKRIAEICVQSMNSDSKTEFITTRFGNVLGSNGSVIPLFKDQIAKGGPITVTHPNIVRYFMTIPEACRLVLQAATMGCGGEILVFDMGKEEKIVDLARKMIQLSGLEPDVDIKIEFTGLRPGEKLYEELLSSNENTKSSHDKIQIAQSHVIDREGLDKQIKRLVLTARQAKQMDTVRLMKEIAPEFKSKNSPFEELDK